MSLNTNNNRVAYISVGIAGLEHGIDLGIRNKGGRWHPCYYDGGHVFKTFDDEESDEKGYIADSTAVCAAFMIMPRNETSVVFSVVFYDENDECVGDFLKIITVDDGNLSFANEQAYIRFYRFISLVPPDGEPDDQSDGTYMLNAGFSELELSRYDSSTKSSWGMTTDLVERAWIISPEKISLNYSSNNESASINHSNE